MSLKERFRMPVLIAGMEQVRVFLGGEVRRLPAAQCRLN